MAFEILDDTSLTLSYQRKASEYLLRMASLNATEGDLLLKNMGQAIISRLCTHSNSVNPFRQNCGSDKKDSASRRGLCLESVTIAQNSLFDHYRNISSTGTDGKQHDLSVYVDSYVKIRDPVDHLFRHDDRFSHHMVRNIVDFVCPSCSSPFLLCSTTEGARTIVRLRRVKRGSSRQRRSLRYRKKQAIFDQQMMKHRGGGKSFASLQSNHRGDDREHFSHGGLIADVSAEKIERNKQHRLRRVRDGQSVQRVVYQCGSCHDRIYYKGVSAFKRKSRCIDRRDVHSDMTCIQKTRDGPIDESSVKDKILSAPMSDTAATKLPEIPPQIVKKRKKENVRAQNTSVKKGKSALMNFLSSLND